MCGIAGIVSTKNEAEFLVQKMLHHIRHRGPDGSGIKRCNEVVFGHVRLSIIDISNGIQPMESNDGSIAVTFNGEIYNYKSLKKDLSYNFKTNSDTEVLIPLYQKYGPKLVNELSGMFAFAIYDKANKQLFCARDRFGEKPFFYSRTSNGDFVFSSELKAIVATGLVSLEIDMDSLSYYIQHLYVPPHKTIYKNINVLEPGHTLVLKDGKVVVEKYWNYPPIQSQMTLTDAKARFAELLEKSVDSQLVSDVEVGALLSGGLDSSTVVALMSKYKKSFKTFSFGFEGEKSELGYAKQVSDLYGTEHIELEERNLDVAQLMFKMNEIYDEPFADSSNIPTYLINKHARKYVKVVLSGDGADELLGGYVHWYKPLTHFNKKNNFPILDALLAKVFFRIHGRLNFKRSIYDRVEGKRLQSSYGTHLKARMNQNSFFTNKQMTSFGLSSYSPLPNFEETNTLNDALRFDTYDYLPGDILVKTDRASMASGLEVRSPFLDKDLAEFLMSLPTNLKITRSEDKILLRQQYSSYWPASIRNRPKQGFGADVDQWMKQDPMVEMKKDYVVNKNRKIHSLVNMDTYKAHSSYQDWILIILSLWLETHGHE